MLPLEVGIKANAIVLNRERPLSAAIGLCRDRLQFNLNPGVIHGNSPTGPRRKRILQSVGDQLIDDQATGDRIVHRQGDVVGANLDVNLAPTDSIGPKQVVDQRLHVLLEINLRQIRRLIQLFVNQRHGLDAVLRVLEQRSRVGILDLARLHPQQTGNDLQIIFNAVVNFLQQHVFFLQRRVELVLRLLAIGDIFDHPQAIERLALSIAQEGSRQQSVQKLSILAMEAFYLIDNGKLSRLPTVAYPPHRLPDRRDD